MRTTGLVLLLLLGCKSKGELPPIANAGLDQAITAGASTSLDGSASSDPGGEIAGFSWTLISLPSGSLGGLTGKEAAAPSLVTDLPGRYVASLVVTDNEGNTSTPDVVEVIALTPSSDRPEARLMATGDLGLGVLLKLDGSASSAPEGRTVSSWSFDVVHAPPGASADIDEGDKPWDATFTPDVKGPGSWASRSPMKRRAAGRPPWCSLLRLSRIWHLWRDAVQTRLSPLAASWSSMAPTPLTQRGQP